MGIRRKRLGLPIFRKFDPGFLHYGSIRERRLAIGKLRLLRILGID
jgi:hypothetical protein